MTDHVVQPLVAEPPTGVGDRWARAYCGPAHGRSWPVEQAGAPAPTATLAADGQQMRYRLVLHPQTRRPARDHLGNYLYMFLPRFEHAPTVPERDPSRTPDAAVR